MSHAYVRDGKVCKVCRRGPRDPVHLLGIPGIDLIAAENARLVSEAEELTEQMRRPLDDISQKTGRMEADSPLFYGKVNATLFE